MRVFVKNVDYKNKRTIYKINNPWFCKKKLPKSNCIQLSHAQSLKYFNNKIQGILITCSK